VRFSLRRQGREICFNDLKQNGYDCLPVALATQRENNKFVGETPARVRVLCAESIQQMLREKIYGSGNLVKDVLTEQSTCTWDTIVQKTLGRTWLGKLQLDALVRATGFEPARSLASGSRARDECAGARLPHRDHDGTENMQGHLRGPQVRRGPDLWREGEERAGNRGACGTDSAEPG
jgi:hypothetical protein